MTGARVEQEDSRSHMDLVMLLIWGAFYALFAVSIRRWLQHRGEIELAVVLVFCSTAGIFAVSALNMVAPQLAVVLGPIGVTLLLLQPTLMLRLVSLFTDLPRWAVPTAFAGCGIVVIAYYASGRAVPTILLLVAYFVITETVAAAAFLREAHRRHGLPRARLTTAAMASLLFGLSVLVSGAGAATRGAGDTAPAVALVSRLLALIAGVGYLGAFVPPRWLRDLGHRSLAFDLVRSIVAVPAGSDSRLLWRALAASAAEILGAWRVVIQAGDAVITHTGSEGTTLAASGRRRGAATSVDVPLEVDDRVVARLIAELPGRPLFIEDDLALVEILGSLTARSAERDEAIARAADAARALADADAVRESEARFRAVVNAEPNAVVVLDGGGRVSWATTRACEMFGVELAELVGVRLADLVAPPLVTTQALGAEAAAVASDGRPTRYQSVVTTEDGRVFPVDVAITDLDGAGARLAVIADDTWRHEANAVRDRFIGVLSHELRTPITAIYGGTQVLLKRPTLDPALRSEVLCDVAAEAERLQRMVENLLVLARVEASTELAEIGPVLVQRVLPAVIDRERAMLPRLDLRVELPGHLPLVAADEGSVGLVVRNLVSNAAKYAGEAATVEVVATAEADGSVTVRVLDDGPGFDPERADDLFQLYFRAQATATAAPGSGIGLFVSRQLVEVMGGRIWAGVRDGGGSEFAFTLPPYVDESVAAMPDPGSLGVDATASAARSTGLEVGVGMPLEVAVAS